MTSPQSEVSSESTVPQYYDQNRQNQLMLTNNSVGTSSSDVDEWFFSPPEVKFPLLRLRVNTFLCSNITKSSMREVSTR